MFMLLFKVAKLYLRKEQVRLLFLFLAISCLIYFFSSGVALVWLSEETRFLIYAGIYGAAYLLVTLSVMTYYLLLKAKLKRYQRLLILYFCKKWLK